MNALLRPARCRLLLPALLAFAACAGPGAGPPASPPRDDAKALIARVRRLEPARTPARFNAIPDRLADILVTRHRCADGPVWGLARKDPDSALPYDEMGSSTFLSLVKSYNLFDRVGPLDEDARRKALAFWQGWQDPATGRFRDPRDPGRAVNEKYVVSLIHSLGGELLHPWSTTGAEKKVETETFLARTKEDPDWADGGWGVGSHTGFMAVEIWEAVNGGRTDLIPDLERGMERILSHQHADGLWGPPEARVAGRIGGALKIIGRFYFKMGMRVPRTRELADTLIDHQRKGLWRKHGDDPCVPRNVAEVAAYCLEASDYRREELLGVLEDLAKDYEEWVNEDGSPLMRWGDRGSAGMQYVSLYGLGILGGYLHWEDCRLPNPLAGAPRGAGSRYRPVLQPSGRVKVVDAGSG